MHRNKQKLRVEHIFPYILIAPSMILIVGFMLFPIISVFHLSIQNYDYNNFAKQGYVGFYNFKKLFTEDKNFIPAIVFTLKWVLTCLLYTSRCV